MRLQHEALEDTKKSTRVLDFCIPPEKEKSQSKASWRLGKENWDVFGMRVSLRRIGHSGSIIYIYI